MNCARVLYPKDTDVCCADNVSMQDKNAFRLPSTSPLFVSGNQNLRFCRPKHALLTAENYAFRTLFTSHWLSTVCKTASSPSSLKRKCLSRTHIHFLFRENRRARKQCICAPSCSIPSIFSERICTCRSRCPLLHEFLSAHNIDSTWQFLYVSQPAHTLTADGIDWRVN